MDYVKQIHLADLKLHDYAIAVDLTDGETDQIFKQVEQPLRILNYRNKFQNSVTYELSSTNQVYYRTVYSFFDWLRDLGGLYGAVTGICLGIVMTFQF